jgi:hypothetical protein
MKIKLLFYSAIIFLVLGLYTKDSVLYYFFAIHLSALALGASLYKREDKMQQKK